MEKYFEFLKQHFGSHKRAAKYLGISYTRYNEWRWRPDDMPEYSKRLVKFGAQSLGLKIESRAK